MFKSVVASVSLVAVATTFVVTAQQPPAGQQPPPQGQQAPQGQGRRGGGGGMRGPAPLGFDNRAGFKAIFDGTSLKDWDGDPDYWRVEGGALVGETTEAKPLKENTFLIYRGGAPADFELKVEFRISNTNSGIQYRSVHLPPGTPSGNGSVAGKWVLKGYQADIDIANQYTGMLYEERGRAFLAPRGSVGYQSAEAKGTIGSLETSDTLKSYIKEKDWNQFHVIANGTTLIHILNGHVTAVFVDDDVQNRTLQGLLGFQIHVGPPMKVEFKNVYLKTL
jgi:3-keto-disaccharide hydrolase